MNLSRIDRVFADIPVTVIDNSDPVTLPAVDVALLPPRTTPTAATVWTAAPYADGLVTVFLAGPEADPTDALQVPAAGADLWIRISDAPEVLAVSTGRITIT